MNPTLVSLVLIGIGFFSGLRAFTPLALVAWLAVWGWLPVAGSPFWFVGTETFAIILLVLAALELIGDKLPKTPARIQPMPLIARVITGAIAGGAVAVTAGHTWFIGSLLAAFGTIVGAFSGYHLRHAITTRFHIPDLLVALPEDFVTIAGTLMLVHNFFHTPV
jgi:uncharacterized membrane protein